MPLFPSHAEIEQRQLSQLGTLLAAMETNPFYRDRVQTFGEKLGLKPVREQAHGPAPTLAGFTEGFPFTTKAELVADQAANPPYGSDLTFPVGRYSRCHGTSGSTGRPLRWLDTPESWNWMLGNWAEVYRAAGVTSEDRIFFAFSFGPFLGFWTAFESALKLGCLALPGGGMATLARLRSIIDHGATVLCCTPTYAIHLGETAAKEGVDLKASKVRVICVAGEPGGSVPAVRGRISQLWNGARIMDHHGMTEVGPVSFECPDRPGVLHVIGTSYIAEILSPETGIPVPRGDVGELVLTTLGRVGSPLLRYRTGDLVRAARPQVCTCGRSDLALEGGILGRSDDMVVVRGVNIFPAAVDDVLRSFPEVVEYQVRVGSRDSLLELEVTVEPDAGSADASTLATRVQKAFHVAFNLRVPVKTAPPGALPRFEHKARRWVRDT